jgi:hypothetical protein
MAQSMVRRLTPRTIAIAAGLPATILAVGSVLMLAGAACGRDLLWFEQPVNMSEAAAARNPAVVARLLRQGEDPGKPRTVRAGFVSNRRVTFTPIEAAIAAQRAEVLEVLLPDARPLDAATWNRLRCLAEHTADRDTSTLLDRWKPDGATLACAGIVPPW